MLWSLRIAVVTGVIDRPADSGVDVSKRAGWDSDRDSNLATLPPRTDTGEFGLQHHLLRASALQRWYVLLFLEEPMRLPHLGLWFCSLTGFGAMMCTRCFAAYCVS